MKIEITDDSMTVEHHGAIIATATRTGNRWTLALGRFGFSRATRRSLPWPSPDGSPPGMARMTCSWPRGERS